MERLPKQYQINNYDAGYNLQHQYFFADFVSVTPVGMDGARQADG